MAIRRRGHGGRERATTRVAPTPIVSGRGGLDSRVRGNDVRRRQVWIVDRTGFLLPQE